MLLWLDAQGGFLEEKRAGRQDDEQREKLAE